MNAPSVRWLLLVVTTALLVGTCAVRRRRAEERRTALAAIAETQQKGSERAARRKACGLPADAALHEPASVQGECQHAVIQGWASPGTAAFPTMFDDDGPLVSPDGCVLTYRSWVDAPDGRGENLRQSYVCTYDPRTGLAKIDLL